MILLMGKKGCTAGLPCLAPISKIAGNKATTILVTMVVGPWCFFDHNLCAGSCIESM